MLLEFRAKNYKSFRDELVFSLLPAPKQTGLDYSLLNTKIGSDEYKCLCSAVIYGPNAAGKTNIIGAMDTFKLIVLRGNIRDQNDKDNPDDASKHLELIPNNTDFSHSPVTFNIKFIDRDFMIEYGFSASLGNFLEFNYQRKILSERLKVNGKLIFNRDQSLKIGQLNHIKDLLVNNFEKNKKSIITIAESNLNDTELFLMNGFKTMFSSKLVSIITNWLDKKFLVIYKSNKMNLVPEFNSFPKKSIYIEKTLNEAAKLFGVNSNAIGYVKDNENEAKLCSLLNNRGKVKAVPAYAFESYGTLRFINIFPIIVYALLKGGTLIIDEFDESIHPMAIMNIINIFHNNDINVHKAQLIFNTQNPIFLNSNLFRRDEIKFVERDDDTHCSTHYSLSDFGTAGKKGVRKNEDYMKNYFIDRYGAIKDIDFTPVFKGFLYGKDDE